MARKPRTAAEFVADAMRASPEERRLRALWLARTGTPTERFHSIVYLWHRRHGFDRRPQG
jgi:hypothetical protein